MTALHGPGSGCPYPGCDLPERYDASPLREPRIGDSLRLREDLERRTLDTSGLVEEAVRRSLLAVHRASDAAVAEALAARGWTPPPGVLPPSDVVLTGGPDTTANLQCRRPACMVPRRPGTPGDLVWLDLDCVEGWTVTQVAAAALAHEQAHHHREEETDMEKDGRT